MTEKWDYHLRIINPSDFELDLKLLVKNRLLKLIFLKSQKKLRRSKGVDVSGDTELIDRFDVDKRFLGLLKTMIGKVWNITRKKILVEDGFDLLDYYIDQAFFERRKDRDWDVVLCLKGQYVRK